MTFQEKSRWIELFANLAVWCWYFVVVARALAAGYPDEPYLMALMVPVVIALVVIHVAAIVAVAVMKPDEANAPLDERDRAIGHRGAVWGYNLLSTGIFLVIFGSFVWWNTFLVVNALLFTFILSEVARLAVEIAGYRRGMA